MEAPAELLDARVMHHECARAALGRKVLGTQLSNFLPTARTTNVAGAEAKKRARHGEEETEPCRSIRPGREQPDRETRHSNKDNDLQPLLRLPIQELPQRHGAGFYVLEAKVGIEPAYTALQAAA